MHNHEPLWPDDGLVGICTGCGRLLYKVVDPVQQALEAQRA